MFELAKPISFGSLKDQRIVNRIAIMSISLNVQQEHVDKDKPILSILLQCPDTGWQETVTWRDNSVLEFMGNVKVPLTELFKALYDKLQNDGKLPEGKVIDDKIPHEEKIAAIKKS